MASPQKVVVVYRGGQRHPHRDSNENVARLPLLPTIITIATPRSIDDLRPVQLRIPPRFERGRPRPRGNCRGGIVG
jgi:hypothetical protein